MTHSRSILVLALCVSSTFACGSSSEPVSSASQSEATETAQPSPKSENPAPAPTTQGKKVELPKAEPTKAEPKADKENVAADPDAVLSDCLSKCESSECADACVDAFVKAIPQNGGAGSGDGRGGDATCCVGGQRWVCHAKGSNGASCDANLSPPGDDCERTPASDSMCQ